MDNHRKEDIIVAIDPGRYKCGLAAVSIDGRVLYKEVVDPESMEKAVCSLAGLGNLRTLVIGDRTAKSKVLQGLSDEVLELFEDGVAEVDEHMSSVEGRDRYLRDHPPKGLKRILPRGMRVPEKPYDDYVAVILAERFITQSGDY